MRRITLMVMFLLIWSPCLTNSSDAAELCGKEFSEKMELHNTAFRLKGLGVKSYLFVRVFVAGFYIEESLKDDEFLDDVPKRLEVAYFHKIPGTKLASETRRRIRLNTDNQEFDRIEDRVNIMDSFFVNLYPGDRYALTYIPNQGTYFSYNEKLIGKIEGSDFAKALFAVWIGKEPISQSLKESLLGNE